MPSAWPQRTCPCSHPALPGVIVHGTAIGEWLEGERFLIFRSRTDHPDFRDAISIIGNTQRDRVDESVASNTQLSMHYFDSRGVFRVYEASTDGETWRLWRNTPRFSQRFTGTFGGDGNVIAGLWQLCEDDAHWHDDLRIVYRRQKEP